MSENLRHSRFVWALLLCLVLVNGFMAAPSVGHAQHHADHHAGTHSTGICAWLCAAGQDIESVSVAFESSLQLVEQAVVAQSDLIHVRVSFHSLFRGPPHLLA